MLLRFHVGSTPSSLLLLSLMFLSDPLKHPDPAKRSSPLLFYLAKARRGEDAR